MLRNNLSLVTVFTLHLLAAIPNAGAHLEFSIEPAAWTRGLYEPALEVRNGEVYSATYQELEGFQALTMLARQKTGLFWLVEKSLPCHRSIHVPGSHLLLELCRTLDEKEPA